MKMILVYASFLFFLVNSPQAQAVDITASPYYADKTGVINCTAIISSALAAADDVYFPNGTYRLDGTVTVPNGKTLRGESKYYTFIKVRNRTAFIAGNTDTIKNFQFVQDGDLGCGDGVVRVIGKSNVTVSNCFFDIVWKQGLGVFADGATQLAVRNCNSSGYQTAGLLRAYGLVDSTISDNVVYGWRSLLIHGMKGCTIVNNTFGGYNDANPGITGICILSQLADNTPEENSVINNIISNNIVQNVSEEGISFDCNGGSIAQRPQHPGKPLVKFYEKQTSSKITVDEYNGNWISSGWPDNWANNYYLVVLTGTEKGTYAKIIDSGGGATRGWVQFADTCSWIDSLSTADILMITTGFFDNTIAKNTVIDTGRAGITFHGACWDNAIQNNHVQKSGNGGISWYGAWGGIQALSVLCGTTSEVDTNPTVSFSGFNSIINNTIGTHTSSSLYTNAWAAVRVDTAIGAGKDLAFMSGFVPQTAQYNPGNFVRGNVISNQTQVVVDKSYASDVTANTTPYYSGAKITIQDSDYSTVTNNYKGTFLMTTGAGDIVNAGGNEGLIAD